MWPYGREEKKNPYWKHISFCLSLSLWLTHPPVQSHHSFSFGSAAKRRWDFAPGSCWVWLQVIVLVKPVLLQAAETALARGALTHTQTHKGLRVPLYPSAIHPFIPVSTSPSHPSVHPSIVVSSAGCVSSCCCHVASQPRGPPTNWPQLEISTEIETVAAAC